MTRQDAPTGMWPVGLGLLVLAAALAWWLPVVRAPAEAGPARAAATAEAPGPGRDVSRARRELLDAARAAGTADAMMAQRAVELAQAGGSWDLLDAVMRKASPPTWEAYCRWRHLAKQRWPEPEKRHVTRRDPGQR